jgi:DNA polymerase-3 subunit beta
MNIIRFTAAELKAAALLAPTKDIRFYLNGVFVEATPTETRLVATDGAALGIVRRTCTNTIDTDVSLIVPDSAIAQLKVGKRDSRMGIEIQIDSHGFALCAPTLGLRISFKPVEGRFPDYRRVVPKDMSGVAGHYQPTYLGTFQKVGQLLLDTSKWVLPRVEQNGESAARVTFDGYDGFIGVLMPGRFAKNAQPANVGWF